MTSTLVFRVQRREPELITPSKPTPHELKYLSDIDDQESLRLRLPVLQFYRNDTKMTGKDPVDVIRKALASVLCFYYPFAGRLREGPGRKLMVDCTGEGVIFIDADADVRLEEFGDLQPPFPCFEQLLFDFPDSGGSDTLNSPPLLIQVTRLSCGGFILGIRFNHTMCDAQGLFQFMSALGEFARGAEVPSVLPVWQREVLSARDPPRVTFPHEEFDTLPETMDSLSISLDDMVQRSFFFSYQDISTLKKHLHPSIGICTTFEILIAFIWKCRTIALNFDPKENVRMVCLTSARGKIDKLLPNGYYGNAFVLPVAISTVENLCKNSLGYAISLVRKAKNQVNEEYMKSTADFMVLNGRPPFFPRGTFIPSNVSRVGFRDVDFGWGRAEYGGLAQGEFTITFIIQSKNNNGEEGILIPISLPKAAMEKFVIQIETMIRAPIRLH